MKLLVVVGVKVYTLIFQLETLCSIMVVLLPSGQKMEVPDFSQMLVAIHKAAIVLPDKNITI
jgi:hypothetical protein